MKIRSFIALEVPTQPKAEITSYLNRWSKAYPNGINWVEKQNLHMTLLFIGDIDSELLPDIKACMYDVCSAFRPFTMKVIGCELYPSIEPRLIWVKLETAQRSIYDLQKKLAYTVRTLGCQPDNKPLKLHVTMGRIKSHQTVAMEEEILKSAFTREEFKYNQITLYQSVLRPEGPVYHALERIILNE